MSEKCGGCGQPMEDCRRWHDCEADALMKQLATLQAENARMRVLVEAVAHIGVDFGYGPYQIEAEKIQEARELLEDSSNE